MGWNDHCTVEGEDTLIIFEILTWLPDFHQKN